MNFFSFTFVWSVSICLIVATMQVTGLGNPNCGPCKVDN